MALLNLSSAQLEQLIRLVREKESLQVKLDRINNSLRSLEANGASPGRPGRKPGRPLGSVGRPAEASGRRGKRLKAPLLKALKNAGAAGITVKDLALKLKVKPNNVFSWFYTTGKKISGIKKIGEARYAMVG